MVESIEMLVLAAEKAGMKIPNDPDKFENEKEEFPHFYVFCVLQLGKSVRYHGEHWYNAEVIANIPEDEIMSLSANDIVDRGFSL